MYPTLPFYRRMLIEAGYPEAASGTWSDAMIDGLVIHGDEAAVTAGVRNLVSDGAGEVLVSPILAGQDRAASLERTLRLLGRLSG